jgi:serine/threonine protein kinase
MTSFTCAKTGQLVSLTEEIANSGEGKVWRTSRKGMLAKIYHVPDEERAKKLDIMVKHAPADPNAHKNHVSFAWPQSVLKDTQGKIVGFLMPEIVGGEQLVNVCNPSRRKRLGLEIDWRFLHVAARNVAALVQAIHKEGYVLGDIKLQNILMNSRALPSIIDVDSFQVKDAATGKVYRCLVGSEGFTPTELFGKDISTVTQEEIHDRFRLGVVIYHLLFGNHPFQGKWMGAGESPELNEMIRKGFWPGASTSLLKASDRTIPLEILDPELVQCFRKCFTIGHTNSSVRPTANDWVKALEIASQGLVSCSNLDIHYYSSNNQSCYWCERKHLLGIDIFEMPQAKTKVIKPNIQTKILTRNITTVSNLFASVSNHTSISQAQPLNSLFHKNVKKKGKQVLIGGGVIVFVLLIVGTIMNSTTQKPPAIQSSTTPSVTPSVSNSNQDDKSKAIMQTIPTTKTPSPAPERKVISQPIEQSNPQILDKNTSISNTKEQVATPYSNNSNSLNNKIFVRNKLPPVTNSTKSLEPEVQTKREPDTSILEKSIQNQINHEEIKTQPYQNSPSIAQRSQNNSESNQNNSKSDNSIDSLEKSIRNQIK